MAVKSGGSQATAAKSKQKTTGGTTVKKKQSTGARRTSNARQTATTKGTSNKKRSVNAKRTNQQRAQQPEEHYTEAIGDEIKLIAILAASILFLLSIFGLGGKIGNRVAYLLFGLFGTMTYAFPFLLFIGTAFHMSNRHSRLARIKLIAAGVLLLMIMSLIAISSSEFVLIAGVMDGYLDAAATHKGGGMIGYSIGWLVCMGVGKIGATVIFVCIALIAFVLMTGKSFFTRLGRQLVIWFGQLADMMDAYREAKAIERARRAEMAENEQDVVTDEADEIEEIDDDQPLVPIRKTRKKKVEAKTEATDKIPAMPSVLSGMMDAVKEQAIAVKEQSNQPKASTQPTETVGASVDVTVDRLDQESIEESIQPKVQPGTKTQPEPKGLDDFDFGQKVEPLHIKVPEFMKGGKITESTYQPAAGENSSRRMPIMESKDSGNTSDRDSCDDSSANAKVTTLTVDDLDLKIIGLDEDEKVEEEVLDGIAVPQTIGIAGGSDPVNEADIEEKAAQLMQTEVEARKQEAETEKPVQTRHHVAKPADTGEVEVMDIVEEEIEKYVFPPLELLKRGQGGTKSSSMVLKETALKLQQTLESFGVGVQVTNVSCGPTVTRYELQPDQGVKVNRIVSLTDDIKLNLAVTDIRIEAPIPGKAAVGIEVPNTHKEMVCLRDLLESPEAGAMKSKLGFAAGKDIGGQTVMADIEKMPHLLIAGATGSGKSVCINTIIMSILYRADPNEVKMIMIDPKVVELNVYNGLPHLLIPVVTEPKKAAGALNWAVTTMMDRYKLFAQTGSKDIKSYNNRIEKAGMTSENYKKLAQIVIIIDELADLMMVAQSEVEDAICRLAQLARAAGIHLVIATQRPSVNVITGLIKANVPSRIAFSVSSGVDSRTILDMVGAEKLLGNGDMLFYPAGFPKPTRVQGAFVSEEEIGRVCDFIKANYTSHTYSEEITKTIESSVTTMTNGATAARDDRDLYFEEAGRFVIEKEKASIGMLQRVFKIGFNRAARIMDQLCDAGVVGPEIGTKPRQIIMTMDAFEQYLAEHQ